MSGVYDELAAFEAEATALDGLLGDLTPAEWDHPSACAGWSVTDVVLHLAQSEEGVIAAFDHGDASRPYAPYLDHLGDTDGDGAVDALVGAAVVAERAEPEVVWARWRAAHAGVRDRLSSADPHQRVPWISVPLAARTLAVTRLSEHWIHGLDIREPLGRPAPDSDRLRFVARLAWRTLPYAFTAAGEAAPSVDLHLTGPSGEVWDFTESGFDGTRPDEPAEVEISGPAGTWCRVAARRVEATAADLEVRGKRGARVLELVRTYA